jgi:hypothetical protein
MMPHRSRLAFAKVDEYFLRNPKEIRVTKPADPPDGPPIGALEY